MSQDLLLVETVDVRRLDDPDDTRVETITKLVFPAVKFLTAEHLGGGTTGKVKYRLPMIEALEPTFSVKGLDRGSVQGVGLVPGITSGWTMAATVRNTTTNKVLPLRATIRGTVCEWTPGEHTPGELLDCDHAWHEITYYELVIAGEQWVEWGVRPRKLILRGVDIFGPYVEALGA